jgi:Integrase core domain
MLATGHQHKYILCITDAFTKYALVTAIENKEAETVAKAIFSKWFCKFGIPAQIHTDGRKEFISKLFRELFDFLSVEHTKTTPAHLQCNTQVEVFNKTIKKYLALFFDDSTLDWENFLPALMLSYNMSYHSTIATTPFELFSVTSLAFPLFQIWTYSECTTENLLLQNITNCYTKSDSLLKTLPKKIKTLQKQILTKMPYYIHSTLTI